MVASTRREVMVAHQPAYLPWPGYLSRLLDTERLVLLDHVQYTDRGWQNRNYIRDRVQQPRRLTVPVRQRFGQSIAEVRLADDRWRMRHWRTLAQCYARTPYWPQWAPHLYPIYHRPWRRLIDLNEALLRLLLAAFDIRADLAYSSTLNLRGAKTDMLVDLCTQTGTTVVRAGTGAPAYLDRSLLRQAGIEVEVVTFTDPTGNGYERLSALDLLLHEGSQARQILQDGARLLPTPTIETVTA